MLCDLLEATPRPNTEPRWLDGLDGRVDEDRGDEIGCVMHEITGTYYSEASTGLSRYAA